MSTIPAPIIPPTGEPKTEEKSSTFFYFIIGFVIATILTLIFIYMIRKYMARREARKNENFITKEDENEKQKRQRIREEFASEYYPDY